MGWIDASVTTGLTARSAKMVPTGFSLGLVFRAQPEDLVALKLKQPPGAEKQSWGEQAGYHLLLLCIAVPADGQESCQRLALPCCGCTQPGAAQSSARAHRGSRGPGRMQRCKATGDVRGEG